MGVRRDDRLGAVAREAAPDPVHVQRGAGAPTLERMEGRVAEERRDADLRLDRGHVERQPGELAAILVRASERFLEMVTHFDRLTERAEKLRLEEHAGDEAVSRILQSLDRTFITPFDREDIHELTSHLDDILDGIQAAAETFVVYGIEKPTDEAKEFAAILAAQASQLVEVLGKLSTHAGILPHIATINDLEHRADGLSRSSVGRLFRESTDAIEVIKLRDLYQQLEEAVDAAQDAGKVISRILAKHH